MGKQRSEIGRLFMSRLRDNRRRRLAALAAIGGPPGGPCTVRIGAKVLAGLTRRDCEQAVNAHFNRRMSDCARELARRRREGAH